MQHQLHAYYLDAMGIQRWELRNTPTGDVDVAECEEKTSLKNNEMGGWEALKQAVATCQQCRLHEGRTHSVFGVGSQQADLLIVGDAPGLDEDKQGIPFVGPTGQLLTAMLAAIEVSRESAYIANVLKCRPPQDRDPLQSEVAQCTQYLNQQIALLQPKVIVALGRHAAQYLLDCDTSLKQLRQESHHYGDSQIPLVVTYHPAYLLRNPMDKSKAMIDLKKIQSLLHAHT